MQTLVYDMQTKKWENRGNTLRTFNMVPLTYDSVNKVMLIFGADFCASCNELWAYDVAANKWTQRSPTPDPVYGIPPGGAPGAAFDSNNGVLVLFGEGDSGGASLDTWVYNAKTNAWKRMLPQTQPPITMIFAHMAYDPINNVVFLYNSFDTWAYRYKKVSSPTDPVPPAPPTGLMIR